MCIFISAGWHASKRSIQEANAFGTLREANVKHDEEELKRIEQLQETKKEAGKEKITLKKLREEMERKKKEKEEADKAAGGGGGSIALSNSQKRSLPVAPSAATGTSTPSSPVPASSPLPVPTSNGTSNGKHNLTVHEEESVQLVFAPRTPPSGLTAPAQATLGRTPSPARTPAPARAPSPAPARGPSPTRSPAVAPSPAPIAVSSPAYTPTYAPVSPAVTNTSAPTFLVSAPVSSPALSSQLNAPSVMALPSSLSVSSYGTPTASQGAASAAKTAVSPRPVSPRPTAAASTPASSPLVTVTSPVASPASSASGVGSRNNSPSYNGSRASPTTTATHTSASGTRPGTPAVNRPVARPGPARQQNFNPLAGAITLRGPVPIHKVASAPNPGLAAEEERRRRENETKERYERERIEREDRIKQEREREDKARLQIEKDREDKARLQLEKDRAEKERIAEKDRIAAAANNPVPALSRASVGVSSPSTGANHSLAVSQSAAAGRASAGAAPAVKPAIVGTGEGATQGVRRDMEDKHVALVSVPQDPGMAFGAVYDGHGGVAAAEFCRVHLHKHALADPVFKSDIHKAITNGFLKTDEEFRQVCARQRIEAGCTACTVFVTAQKIICANAGDSRAILSRKGQVFELSHDHKPFDAAERKRIEKAGSRVEDNRVDGRLAVSRAIGDFDFKRARGLPPDQQPVSPAPDILEEDRTPDDEYIVLACDGLWDILENESVLGAYTPASLCVCACLCWLCPWCWSVIIRLNFDSA